MDFGQFSNERNELLNEVNALIAATSAAGLPESSNDSKEKNLRRAKKVTSKIFGLFDKKVELIEVPSSNQNISAVYQVKRNGVFEEVLREDIIPGDIIRMDMEQSFPCDCVLYNKDSHTLDDFYTYHSNMGCPAVLKISDIHKALVDSQKDIPMFYRGDIYYGTAKTEKAFDYVHAKVALDSRLLEYNQAEIDALKDLAKALPNKDEWSEDEMKKDGMAIFIKTVSREIEQKKEIFINEVEQSKAFLEFIAVRTGKNCREEKAQLFFEYNNKNVFRFCKVKTVFI